MEKQEFLNVAPLYYAIAIIHYLAQVNKSKAINREGLIDFFVEREAFDSQSNNCLEHQPLLDRAFTYIVEKDILQERKGMFGPSLFFRKENGPWVVQDLLQDEGLPFYLYANAPDGGAWLRLALSEVNQLYNNLGIEAADFEDQAEWEPIPLDRTSEELQAAIQKLDEAAEEIRSSNGYAQVAPEERNFVIEKLAALSMKLKTETTISWMWIKEFGIDPLNRVVHRFGPAAVGVIAQAAKDGLVAWIKTNSGKAIDWLLKQTL